MASIIKASINLNEIPKDKIIIGKKGKYLPVTITINDEVDQFGNQGPIVVAQTKEEREAKQGKTYLGNVQVVWTNGDNVPAAPRQDQPAQAAPAPAPADDPYLVHVCVSCEYEYDEKMGFKKRLPPGTRMRDQKTFLCPVCGAAIDQFEVKGPSP